MDLDVVLQADVTVSGGIQLALSLSGGIMDVKSSIKLQHNTLKSTKNGQSFADDIFKCVLFYQNCCIPIHMSLTFVPNGPMNDMQVSLGSAWNTDMGSVLANGRTGGKVLSEQMLA